MPWGLGVPCSQMQTAFAVPFHSPKHTVPSGGSLSYLGCWGLRGALLVPWDADLREIAISPSLSAKACISVLGGTGPVPQQPKFIFQCSDPVDHYSSWACLRLPICQMGLP